jgi:hypothetical protein
MFHGSARRLSTLAVVALLCAGPGAASARAQAAESPCAIETTERVVAVGDVHGAYERFTGILRAAGLIDQRDRWSGGRAILVQTGDILDRGADSRRVIDLLRRLERDAPRAGGRVYPLLGNHEFMRAAHDWRYVSAKEYEAFKDSDSEHLQKNALERMLVTARRRAQSEGRHFDAAEYRDQFMKDIPPGYLEMRRAFDKGGEYGEWVRKRLAAVKVNGVLFVHAGVSEKTASLGCEGMNEAIRADLDALPVAAERVPSMFASSADGPLWYRGLAMEPEDAFAPTVDRILTDVRARAIVIGHTPGPSIGRIATRFGGRVILIDTGMLQGDFYPGGTPSALELHGEKITAIYDGRSEPLSPPTPHR